MHQARIAVAAPAEPLCELSTVLSPEDSLTVSGRRWMVALCVCVCVCVCVHLCVP
jgi:hypothetical protein